MEEDTQTSARKKDDITTLILLIVVDSEQEVLLDMKKTSCNKKFKFQKGNISKCV